MINRENWLDSKLYIAYMTSKGLDGTTIGQAKRCLWHLLMWADEKPFGQARSIDPPFPAYLLTSRNDGKAKQLSASSMNKICQNVRAFFEFIRAEHPGRYRLISKGWVETVKPGTRHGMQSIYREHEFYTVDQVRRLATIAVKSLRQERDRAAAVFLFLSAMRVQAFVSLPLKCVDLDRLIVQQLPEMGVKTKNRKAAKTALLRVNDLLEVVRAWDTKMRGAGQTDEDLWFPVLSHLGEFTHLKANNFKDRPQDVSKGVRLLCGLAGVPYMSMHKFRHGHIYFMMKRIKDMKGLKALSQNVMHSSVAITDGIYGRLVSDDIQDTYEDVGE